MSAALVTILRQDRIIPERKYPTYDDVMTMKPFSTLLAHHITFDEVVRIIDRLVQERRNTNVLAME